ncbi:MAG: hypothetical protein Q7R93_02490 [bacterium]|nr:hypothetical protein [bacterium]
MPSSERFSSPDENNEQLSAHIKERCAEALRHLLSFEKKNNFDDAFECMRAVSNIVFDLDELVDHPADFERIVADRSLDGFEQSVRRVRELKMSEFAEENHPNESGREKADWVQFMREELKKADTLILAAKLLGEK